MNHTANNSYWLLDHPEAAYNTDDCPHLVSAFVLDKAIADFSKDYAEIKNMKDCPSAPYIRSEMDLQNVMNALANRVIPPLKLHEYFFCDTNKVISGLEEFFSTFEEDEHYKVLEYKF